MQTPQKNLKLCLFLLSSLVVFLNYLFRFEGPVQGYWDTYIAVPAALMTNHPVRFIDKDGKTLYHYELARSLPENLVDRNTFGISSKDQRIGGAIIFTPWYLLLGLLGFRIFFAITGLLIFIFTYLGIRACCNNFAIGLSIAILATLNTYILSVNSLNPNLLGFMIGAFLIFLVLNKTAPPAMIGFVFGVLGGIRPEAVIFTPAILYHLYAASEKKTKVRNIAVFLVFAALAILPILYWNRFAFGNPFMHPTQFHELGGFRPEFQHHFFFWKFNFNGMLNYPFHHLIVRTPYFPFPVFLLLPLTFMNTFGIMLSGLTILGILEALRRQKHTCLFLGLWFLPMWLLLSVQENWSELKMTFILLLLNPLLIFMAIGFHHLVDRQSSKKNMGRFFCIIIVLFCFIKIAFLLNFESDARWYERFPRAREKTFSYVGDDLRSVPEDQSKLLWQKRYLTAGGLFPRLSNPFKDMMSGGRAKINQMRKEACQDTLIAVDYWRYIYGETS